MLKYVANTIKRFHHKHPQKQQDQPYPQIKPSYRSKAQYSLGAGESPLLTPANKTFVQEVTVTFLYYARYVVAKMLTALGSITNQQANPTKNTIKKVTQFLDYAASHPDTIITCNASNMVLAGQSDASYLS